MIAVVTLVNGWHDTLVVRGDVDLMVKAGWVYVERPVRYVGGAWVEVPDVGKAFFPDTNVAGVAYR